MQNFIAGVIIKVLADPKVQAFLVKTAEDLVRDVVKNEIAPLIPVSVGAAVKTAVDDVIAKIPGLSGAVNIAKTTEAAAGSLVNLVPGLSSVLKTWGVSF